MKTFMSHNFTEVTAQSWYSNTWELANGRMLAGQPLRVRGLSIAFCCTTLGPVDCLIAAA